MVAPPLIPSFHTKTEFQRTSNLTGNQSGLPVGQNGFPLMHKLSSTSETQVSESTEQETKLSKHQPPQSDSDCAHQQHTSSQHRKKKSKKHKDKERERLKDNKGSEWLETSPDLKQKPDKLDSKDLCEKIFLVTDDLLFSVIVWRAIRTFCLKGPISKTLLSHSIWQLPTKWQVNHTHYNCATSSNCCLSGRPFVRLNRLYSIISWACLCLLPHAPSPESSVCYDWLNNMPSSA